MTRLRSVEVREALDEFPFDEWGLEADPDVGVQWCNDHQRLDCPCQDRARRPVTRRAQVNVRQQVIDPEMAEVAPERVWLARASVHGVDYWGCGSTRDAAVANMRWMWTTYRKLQPRRKP